MNAILVIICEDKQIHILNLKFRLFFSDVFKCQRNHPVHPVSLRKFDFILFNFESLIFKNSNEDSNLSILLIASWKLIMRVIKNHCDPNHFVHHIS